MSLKPNPGRIPPECVVWDEAGEVTGYRPVHITLHNGFSTRARGDAPWPSAGGRPPTVWKLSRPPHPFEIETWEIA